MLTFDRDEVARHLPYAALIAALRTGLPAAIATPPRVHHVVGKPSDLLLMMPSWRNGDRVGVKLTTVFPGNAEHSLSMIHAVYTLIDGRTGVPLAVMNGTELTLRRTAALAALATDLLASRRGGRLLIMGTGALAGAMIRSHLALGAWERIAIWGRSPDKATAVAATLAKDGIAVEVAAEAEPAARAADVICCVTASQQPILHAAWVSPGAHVNLFGAYLPTMREGDSDLIAGAELYVDNREAAMHEAGDVLIPLGEGHIAASHIRAEMRELLAAPQRERGKTTVFKSVGFGALDLIAAETVLAGSEARLLDG